MTTTYTKDLSDGDLEDKLKASLALGDAQDKKKRGRPKKIAEVVPPVDPSIVPISITAEVIPVSVVVHHFHSSDGLTHVCGAEYTAAQASKDWARVTCAGCQCENPSNPYFEKKGVEPSKVAATTLVEPRKVIAENVEVHVAVGGVALPVQTMEAVRLEKGTEVAPSVVIGVDTSQGHDQSAIVVKDNATGRTFIVPPNIERGKGRPKAGYYTRTGRRCVSVTTVLSKFGDSGGLLGWYYKNGITDGLRQAAGEPMIGSDNFAVDATTIGSAVHARVEAFLCGERMPEPLKNEEWETKAARCFESWTEWFLTEGLAPVALELPLVHHLQAIAGTLDGVFRDKDGRLVLLDWKTSATVYSSALVQAAAYKYLWEEDLREDIARCAVLRIDKDTGRRRYVPMNARELVEPTKQWIRLFEAYRADAEIAKLLK